MCKFIPRHYFKTENTAFYKHSSNLVYFQAACLTYIASTIILNTHHFSYKKRNILNFICLFNQQLKYLSGNMQCLSLSAMIIIEHVKTAGWRQHQSMVKDVTDSDEQSVYVRTGTRNLQNRRDNKS